jgi:hypothetical protein
MALPLVGTRIDPACAQVSLLQRRDCAAAYNAAPHSSTLRLAFTNTKLSILIHRVRRMVVRRMDSPHLCSIEDVMLRPSPVAQHPQKLVPSQDLARRPSARPPPPPPEWHQATPSPTNLRTARPTRATATTPTAPRAIYIYSQAPLAAPHPPRHPIAPLRGARPQRATRRRRETYGRPLLIQKNSSPVAVRRTNSRPSQVAMHPQTRVLCLPALHYCTLTTTPVAVACGVHASNPGNTRES